MSNAFRTGQKILRRMKKIFIIIVIVGLCSAGGAIFLRSSGNTKLDPAFQVAPVIKGDLENVVSSTGTLSAVGTVAVGTQVSGTMEKVLVDFNDKVKKGQLLAVLDTTLARASVQDAEASVMQCQTQLNQANTEYKRNQALFQQGYVSEMTLLAMKTNVATARAALKSAEATLKRAQTNLGYAEIRSPIDGTVIERSIDAGQTVAASLNTPTLFTIAEDLAHMQIEASVDESDIGQIKAEQSVRFTVQAYPDDVFTGTVRQIRLKPKTIQDVVNYTVMIDASNERSLLLPGMTATVDFLVEERKDVLLVPNTAIYFKPTEEMLAKYGEQMRGKRPDGRNSNRQTGQNGQMSGVKRPDNLARVFYLDEHNAPAIAPFVPGVTNGIMTEIKESLKLKEGMKVITGVNTQEQTKRAGMSLPMPPGAGRRGGF
jgi:HlyD family secretion protein